MRVLVIGASGLIGGYIYRHLQARGETVFGTYYSQPHGGLKQLNICAPDEVRTIIAETRPTVVYLAAAFTSVDVCEVQPDLSHRINVNGVKNVVDSIKGSTARVIYISTDYVFNGDNGPYNEYTPVQPINTYGHQKAAAEHYIATHAADWTIVRTTWVYGREAAKKNFVYRVLQTLRAGETLYLAQELSTPTFAGELAKRIGFFHQGILHLSGDSCTRIELAKKVAKLWNLDPNLVQPGNPKTTARRPMLGGLRSIYGPPTKDGLEQMHEEEP